MGTSKQKSANSGERSRSQSRAKLKKLVKTYWKKDVTLWKIATLVGCRQPTVRSIFVQLYGEAAVKDRSKMFYCKSKLGFKNPMSGKTFEKHHNWKGSSSDHKGYRTVVKPIWWTGTNKKRIFEHHYIYARVNGLTEIPKGYDIHHKDLNGENNDPSNLQLLTKRAHASLHTKLRKV